MHNLMIAAGLVVMVVAVIVWVSAVLDSHMAESVKTGQLMTSGIYAWIWHPVYSSFLLLNCGLLLIQTNW